MCGGGEEGRVVYTIWSLGERHLIQSSIELLTFTFHFQALEKEMTTHSSVLAWRIPGTGEPGGLPSMRSHRVRHDWSDLAAAAAFFKVRFSTSTLVPPRDLLEMSVIGPHTAWTSWIRNSGQGPRNLLTGLQVILLCSPLRSTGPNPSASGHVGLWWDHYWPLALWHPGHCVHDWNALLCSWATSVFILLPP